MNPSNLNINNVVVSIGVFLILAWLFIIVLRLLTPRVHIYQLDECTWIAARSPWEAIQGFLAGHDESDQSAMIDRIQAFGGPKKMSNKQLDTLIYDAEELGSDNSMFRPQYRPVKRTFRQQLTLELCDGRQTPWLFASSEY